MALGFPPKFIREIEIENINEDDFLLISADTISRLNWKIKNVSPGVVNACTNIDEKSSSDEISVYFKNNSLLIESESSHGCIMDRNKNKQNVDRFISELKIVISDLSNEKYKDKLKPFITDKIEIHDQNETSLNKLQVKKFNILSIFVPRNNYFITPILINLNILIFILMAITGVNIMEPDSESLLLWGANFKPYTLDGQLWRLLTSCFIHIGILHLLLNMYALFFIGIILEPFLGKARFLSAYLLAGISSSVASILWNDITISAGASGAIFGMYGVFLALLTTNLLDKTIKKTFLTSVIIFVVGNLLFGIKDGIDNAGHIGGLLSGILIGYSLIPSLRNNMSIKTRTITISLLTIILLSFAYIVSINLTNDLPVYFDRMEKFEELELRAMEVHSVSQYTTTEELLKIIREKGINSWKENINIIESFDDLDLPESVKKRNIQLKEYSNLRLNIIAVH